MHHSIYFFLSRKSQVKAWRVACSTSRHAPTSSPATPGRGCLATGRPAHHLPSPPRPHPPLNSRKSPELRRRPRPRPCPHPRPRPHPHHRWLKASRLTTPSTTHPRPSNPPTLNTAPRRRAPPQLPRHQPCPTGCPAPLAHRRSRRLARCPSSRHHRRVTATSPRTSF